MPRHARPKLQRRLRQRLEQWVADYGGLPERVGIADGSQLTKDLRRAYARGTLLPDTEARLRELGADEHWLSPRRAAMTTHLGATVAFITVNRRWPRERDMAAGLPIGRWFRELRRRAHNGQTSKIQGEAIAALRAVASSIGLSDDALGLRDQSTS